PVLSVRRVAFIAFGYIYVAWRCMAVGITDHRRATMAPVDRVARFRIFGPVKAGNTLLLRAGLAFAPKIAIIAESLGVRIQCAAQVRPPVRRWAFRPFFFAETVRHLG
ncbi:hypothetical protein, partial [Burkholderia sp. LMG 13014]|uniref:hypothetical protein n=1 Tax=Burkholderia sp. LMG 13014 TaxID=2709306 RepID=UPI001965F357